MISRASALLLTGVLIAGVAGAQSAPDLTEAAPQISSKTDRGAVEQLSRPKVSEPLPQVAPTLRSTQTSQTLEDRTAGRTAATAPVGGADRCDPATASEKQSKLCREVIETRAREFQRRAPTELTPEQKLLLAREIEGGGSDVADASRRLASTGEADDTTASLGIAWIVLKQNDAPPPPSKDKEPVIDSATQAIINAIVANAPTAQ